MFTTSRLESAEDDLLLSPFRFSDSTDSSTPFRQRDQQVMIELFHQEGIEAIEEDIVCNLLWRCPEPCWEDDPFEFLQEYL